jgi:hypothetical protein
LWGSSRGVKRVLLAVLLAMVVGACRRQSSWDERLAAGPRVVEVGMREYSFEYVAPPAGGRVVFRADNRGTLPHELVIVNIPEDVPSLAEQIKGTERRVVATLVSLPTRPPSMTGTFAVDLERGGRYGMICFVQDPDGIQHGVKGMNSEFRVP